MSAMSAYLEKALYQHLLTGAGGAFTAPATLYMALCTAHPFSSDTAAEGSDLGSAPQNECTYTGYARKSITSSSSNWGALDSLGRSSNLNDITFLAKSDVGSVNVTHWALCDASTAGKVLLYGALTASKTIDQNDVPQFPVGSLLIKFD